MNIYLKINWVGGYGKTFKINDMFFSFVDKLLFINKNKNNNTISEKHELKLNELKTIYSSRSGLTYEGLFPLKIDENKVEEIIEIPFFRTDFENFEVIESESYFSIYDRKKKKVEIKYLRKKDFKYDLLILEPYSEKEYIFNVVKVAKINNKLYLLNRDLFYNKNFKNFAIISNHFIKIKKEKYVKIGSIFRKVDDELLQKAVYEDSKFYRFLMKNQKIF